MSESINQLIFSAPLYKPLLTLHTVDFYWKFIRRLNHEMRPIQSITYNFQIDMSKCMVAFIDWYHESMDGTPRRKVKVSLVSGLKRKLFLLDYFGENPTLSPFHLCFEHNL